MRRERKRKEEVTMGSVDHEHMAMRAGLSGQEMPRWNMVCDNSELLTEM